MNIVRMFLVIGLFCAGGGLTYLVSHMEEGTVVFAKDVSKDDPTTIVQGDDETRVVTIDGNVVTIKGRNNVVRTDGAIVQSTEHGIIIIGDGQVVQGGETLNIVEGSGKIASETRNLAAFDNLLLQIHADVTITTGDETQCVVTADDNILPLILTESVNGRLRITAKESFSTEHGITIAMTMPLLTGIVLDGSGDIHFSSVTKEQVDIRLNGSGDVTAEGELEKLNAVIAGSGDLHLLKLQATEATVMINGSGDAEVWVTESLHAEVNGSGDIRYTGAPSKIHTAVKGSGRVTPRQ